MKRLKWVIGAMFVVVVLFQCFEVMNSGPKPSLLGSLRIHFGPKNVSQIDDSSFLVHFGGGSSKGSETSQRGETNLTTDSSPQNGERKGNDTRDHLSGTSGKVLPNVTFEVDTKSPGDGKQNSTMKPVSENSLPPSPVEEVSGTTPLAYFPSYAKTNTSENENARFASPPLPPENEPSVPPMTETTKKNYSAEEPVKSQTPTKKEETKQLPKVVSISQMNDMLRQSRHSYRAMVYFLINLGDKFF